MLLSLLTACAGDIVVVNHPNADKEDVSDVPVAVEGAVKTGLAITNSFSSSKDASAEGDGLAQAYLTAVAVTVDDAGVIADCVIDAVQANVNFDTAGQITSDLTAPILTKNELGSDYGMHKASSIGKDWHEQAQAFADFCVGKNIADLRGVAVSAEGKAGDADLAASVTVYVTDFIDGVEKAAANATHLGAQATDELKLTSRVSVGDSVSAGEEDGSAKTNADFVAATFNGETITSCLIDSILPALTFGADGTITGDMTAAVLTTNELGNDYGMHKASSIGKDWHEQAAGFAAYCVGKTVAEVTNTAVTAEGKAAEADLAASVTLFLGSFTGLVGKLAE